MKHNIIHKLKPYLYLIRLDKPIGTLLLLYPTLWALIIASNGRVSLKLLLVFSLGVLFTRCAGCAINDYADVDFDKHVARTKNRPLVTGAITKTQALYTCVLFSVLSLILAISYLHYTTILFCIPAFIIFVTYPFMKRIFILPQAYLGIAFSFGIPMVFMQVLGYFPLSMYLLFFTNMLWILAYDTIYAMVDEEDDIKINMKTSAITLGRFKVVFLIACFTLSVGLLFSLGYILNLNHYYFALIILVLGLFAYQIKEIVWFGKERYFKMFLFNNWVGLVILLAFIVGLPLHSII